MNLDKIRHVIAKIERTDRRIGNKFPHLTENGRWKTTSDGSWTGGFWVGILWLAYLSTGNDKFAEKTWKWLQLLEKRKDEKMFDLGFIFYPSFVMGYRITGSNYLRKVALRAAETLASLYHSKSGFICQEIQTKGGRLGRTCIDLMMDLPLLWWAYDETGREKFYNVAYKHSIKTMENLIGPRGPKIQAVDLDLETGKIVQKLTLHGYSYNSRWTRGMAWCIYGFAIAHAFTSNDAFLRVAERIADILIQNLPADFVPYWDLDDPNIPNAPRDSSASAIACSGFITLHRTTGRERFRKAAKRILDSLFRNYLVEKAKDGILSHGCFDYPKKIGVNESLIWGDYYFLEALLKWRDFEILKP